MKNYSDGTKSLSANLSINRRFRKGIQMFLKLMQFKQKMVDLFQENKLTWGIDICCYKLQLIPWAAF